MGTELLRLEARISAQERTVTVLNGHIQELSRDMDASFKKLAEYHKHNEEQIDLRFNEVDARFNEVDARFNEVDARFDRVDARLDKIDARLDGHDARFDGVDARFDQIEAIMATKEDMAALEVRIQSNMDAMEGRILDAFKQLLVMVDSRLPPASQSR